MEREREGEREPEIDKETERETDRDIFRLGHHILKKSWIYQSNLIKKFFFSNGDYSITT